MRLIDADAINFEDMCDCCPSADCGDCPGPEGFASWLKKQPTAYDPDKIVEQLEELAKEHPYKVVGEPITYGYYNEAWSDCSDRAIGIVKSGGKV